MQIEPTRARRVIDLVSRPFAWAKAAFRFGWAALHPQQQKWDGHGHHNSGHHAAVDHGDAHKAADAAPSGWRGFAWGSSSSCANATKFGLKILLRKKEKKKENNAACPFSFTWLSSLARASSSAPHVQRTLCS